MHQCNHIRMYELIQQQQNIMYSTLYIYPVNNVVARTNYMVVTNVQYKTSEHRYQFFVVQNMQFCQYVYDSIWTFIHTNAFDNNN